MILDLEGFDVPATALQLALDIMAQLGRRHLLRLLRGDKQLVGNDRQRDILARAPLQTLAQPHKRTLRIMVEVPVFQGIIVDAVGREARDERLSFEILDGAAVADLRAALERLDIENRTRFHFQLDIPGILRREMLHVFVGEIEHSLRAARDDPSAEQHA